MKVFDNEIVKKILNVFILAITCIVVFILPNEYNILQYIGYSIIAIVVIMLLRFRKQGKITLLIGIIMLISLCLTLSVCFSPYDEAKNWQIKLVGLEENIICAKNYLLFLCFFSIGLGTINYKNLDISKPKYNNWIITIGGILVLIYILIFQFDRGKVGEYTSNTKPLYEYAIIMFLFIWLYNNNNKIKIILFIYAILYCLQGLIYGDRSSAFPMLLLLLILFWKKGYKMQYIVILALGGIFFSNVIDIFRNGGNIFSIDTIKEILSRGLKVNTISYSFYGGTQVIRYGMVSDNKFSHLIQYILAIFEGGTAKLSLTVLANSFGIINKGGGMTHTYLYYWGGYLGTVIGALLMGNICKKVFGSNNRLNNILSVTIIIYSIRWLIYYPIAFFRTALLIPLLVYFICEVLNKLLELKKCYGKINMKIIKKEIDLYKKKKKDEYTIKKENKNKKQIYIHGSFMNDNFGDFLLYYVSVKAIEKTRDDIYIYSADVDKTYDQYCMVNRKNKLKAIFSANAAIFAGGGYFGEPDKNKIYWNLRFLFKHLIPAYIIKMRKIPYVILGIEAGPITFKISKILMKNLFNNAKIVSVRNNDSKEFLNDIGVKTNIEVIPDWVLSQDVNKIPKEDITDIIEHANGRKKMFVHLTTKEDEKSNIGMVYALRDLKKYAEEEKNIYFYIGCDQDRESKKARAESILKKLPEGQAEVVYYKGPWKLCSVLNEMDTVITDKLHVGIVGVRFNKPVISVASHSKSVRFYRFIEKEENTIHIKNIKEGELYSKLKDIAFKDPKLSIKIFENAQKNKILLNKFMEEL